jgi:acyl-coenzyme A synthetase/AMP-(fatty) acid ligase
LGNRNFAQCAEIGFKLGASVWKSIRLQDKGDDVVLRRLSGVIDCAAIGVDDDILGQEIKVVVVSEAPTLSPVEITKHLAEHLPPFMYRRYVEFVQMLPKTETEKIQRHKIAYLSDAVIDLQRRDRNTQLRNDADR